MYIVCLLRVSATWPSSERSTAQCTIQKDIEPMHRGKIISFIKSGFKRMLKYEIQIKFSDKFKFVTPDSPTISGFRRQADENCALMRYYAASSGNFLPTFRNKISFPSNP